MSLNFQVTYDKNITRILHDVEVLGLGSWVVMRWSNNKGDGSSEYPCPMKEYSSNSCVHLDCTSHMSDWGEKDATHIMDQFWRKMNEIDQDRKLTDCVFFDGALNFQTAGQILCITYPWAMCFHGGDHVLSLIFSDLSKLKPIMIILYVFYMSLYLF